MGFIRRLYVSRTTEQTIQKIKDADNKKSIYEVKIGKWSIWPLIRYYISMHFLSAKNGTKRRRFFPYFYGMLKALSITFFHNLFMPKPQNYDYIFFYDRRQLQEGSNVLYGNFIEKFLQNEKVLLIEYSTYFSSRNTQIDKNTYSYFPTVFFIYFVSLFLSKISFFRSRAEEVLSQLDIGFSEDEKKFLIKKNAFHIACFCLNKKIFKNRINRKNVKAIFLSNFNGKLAEVAAARELGVQVFELQHGIFGPKDPDYSLTYEASPYKKFTPLPDKILVYGEAWANLLLMNGYWRDDQIEAVGSAAIENCRTVTHVENSQTILFIMQPFLVDFSYCFLSDLLQDSFKDVRICIKFHPLDDDKEEFIQHKFKKLGDNIEIYDSNHNVYNLVKRSKLILGYSSTVLFEGVMTGVPALSIDADIQNNTVDQITGIPELNKLIPTVKKASEVLSYIKNYDENYAIYLKQKSYFNDFFMKEGFSQNLDNFIKGL